MHPHGAGRSLLRAHPEAEAGAQEPAYFVLLPRDPHIHGVLPMPIPPIGPEATAEEGLKIVMQPMHWTSASLWLSYFPFHVSKGIHRVERLYLDDWDDLR